MGAYDLLNFSSGESLSDTAAARWLDDLEAARKGPGPYCVALSGGRIARQFFSGFEPPGPASAVSTGVGPFLLERRALRAPGRLGKQFWSRPRRNPVRAAGHPRPSYPSHRGERPRRGPPPPRRKRSCGTSPLRAKADNPSWTSCSSAWVKMAMWRLYFPGNPQEIVASPAVYRPVTASKPPPRRITLGYPAIRPPAKSGSWPPAPARTRPCASPSTPQGIPPWHGSSGCAPVLASSPIQRCCRKNTVSLDCGHV